MLILGKRKGFMNSIKNIIYNEKAFSRKDEDDDAVFYQHERFVNHLDETALETVKKIIGTLVVEKEPVILDLMAGWDSHIPDTLLNASVIGLGMNRKELQSNTALADYVIKDINRDPVLPFDDETFDVVLNTVSVDYMTRPFEVFREVNRVLKPGGLFLVIFSNRMFPEKAVQIWKQADDSERVMIVEDYFSETEGMEDTDFFCSMGRPRPPDDKYASMEIPSDPVFAVYAQKKNTAENSVSRPELRIKSGFYIQSGEIERRRSMIKDTMRCPYCDQSLKKWKVPENPFVEWDAEFMYICFNNECPYLLNGWDVMAEQGNLGCSYRLMYNPDRNSIKPLPVNDLKALRDGIIED